MKKLWILLGLLFLGGIGFFLWTTSKKQALVFVQVGEEIPSHCIHALYQAKKYHQKKQIYCVGNRNAIQNLPKNQKKICNWIALETIPKSDQHKLFLEKWTNGHKDFKKGYYFFLIDRYFTLYDLMKWKGLQHTFLLESDVLLFDQLFRFVPILRQKNWDLAVPIENQKAFPTILYVSNRHALKPLLENLKNWGRKGATDNQVFTKMWQEKEQANLGSLSELGLFDSGNKAALLVSSNPKSRLYPYFSAVEGRIVWMREKGKTNFVPFLQTGDHSPEKIISLHVQSKQLKWFRDRFTK